MRASIAGCFGNTVEGWEDHYMARFGFGRRSSSFLLTPPALPVFLISLVIAAAALLVHYAGVSIPMLSRQRAFDVRAPGGQSWSKRARA